MRLALAIALWVQEPTAEEAHRKLEEALGKAKTLSLKFRCEAVHTRNGQERKLASEGTLLLKGEGQARMESRTTRDGQEQRGFSGTLVSDGTRARATSGSNPREADTPKDLRAALTFGPSTSGMLFFLALARMTNRGSDAERPLVPDLRKTVSVSGFKLGDGEGGAKTLTCVVKTTTPEASETEIVLHYEPAGPRLLKRLLTFTTKDEKLVMTETYEEFRLDAELKDELFKLDGK
jgi:outer membrane lipoprotein-sorting protein